MVIVAYIISNLRRSGPVNVLLDICKCLDKRVYSPIIITLKNEDVTRSIQPEFEKLGITIIQLNYSNLQLELFPGIIAKQVLRCIPQGKKTIIHAHCYNASAIASRINSFKTVETIHCIAGEDYPLTYGKVKGSYLRRRHIANLRRISYPVVISQYMYRYYKNKCISPITIINNGVSFHHDSNVDVEAIKKRLGLPEGKKIVLYSGNFSVRKNAGYILSELKKSEHSNFVMVLLGKGRLLEDCKEIAGSDPRFIFKGYVSNVVDYLEVADIYISASKSEGFPLAVLEALIMGIPSLLSSIPPHEEIVKSINVPGIQTFVLEEGDLVRAFDCFFSLSFDKKVISSAAQAIFTASVMTSKYEDLYKSILNNSL